MPKRLESSKDMLASVPGISVVAMEKIAVRLELIQKQLDEKLNLIRWIDEQLEANQDPTVDQKLRQDRRVVHNQMAVLRQEMKDAITQNKDQLTYDQLIQYQKELGLTKPEFPDAKAFEFPAPEGTEGPSDMAGPFYPAQLEKDLGLPTSIDPKIKSDERIDFDSVKEQLYPDLENNELSVYQQQEILDEVERQRAEVAGYATKKIKKNEQDAQRRVRELREKSERADESRSQTGLLDIIENDIWGQLPGDGKYMPAGFLNDQEIEVIKQTFPHASEVLSPDPSEEYDPEGTSRFDEFVQDLFEAIKSNREHMMQEFPDGLDFQKQYNWDWEPENDYYGDKTSSARIAKFILEAADIPQEIKDVINDIPPHLNSPIFEPFSHGDKDYMVPAGRTRFEPSSISIDEASFWKGKSEDQITPELIEFRKNLIQEKIDEAEKSEESRAKDRYKLTQPPTPAPFDNAGNKGSGSYLFSLNVADAVNRLFGKYPELQAPSPVGQKAPSSAPMVAVPGESDERGLQGEQSVFMDEGTIPGLDLTDIQDEDAEDAEDEPAAGMGIPEEIQEVLDDGDYAEALDAPHKVIKSESVLDDDGKAVKTPGGKVKKIKNQYTVTIRDLEKYFWETAKEKDYSPVNIDRRLKNLYDLIEGKEDPAREALRGRYTGLDLATVEDEMSEADKDGIVKTISPSLLKNLRKTNPDLGLDPESIERIDEAAGDFQDQPEVMPLKVKDLVTDETLRLLSPDQQEQMGLGVPSVAERREQLKKDEEMLSVYGKGLLNSIIKAPKTDEEGGALSREQIKAIEEERANAPFDGSVPSLMTSENSPIRQEVKQFLESKYSSEVVDFLENKFGKNYFELSDKEKELTTEELLSIIPQKEQLTRKEVLELVNDKITMIGVQTDLLPGGVLADIGEGDKQIVWETTLANQFRKTWGPKPFASKNPEKREEEKRRRTALSHAGGLDTLYLAHRDSWISELNSIKSLTENQTEAAKTWYDYEYWFENVYKREKMGPEQTLEERADNLASNPTLGIDQLDDFAENAPKTESERTEQRQRRKKLPFLYDDLNEAFEETEQEVADFVEGLPEYASLDEKQKKAVATSLLGSFYEEKVADFLRWDDDIRKALKNSPVYKEFAEGKFKKYDIIGDQPPDAASIVQKFVSQSINSGLENGLPLIKKAIQSTNGDQVEGLKKYIRLLIRPALSNEVQTQRRRINLGVKEFSVPETSPEVENYFRDYDADPAGMEQEFEQSATELQRIADSSLHDLMRGDEGWAKYAIEIVLSKLDGEDKELWEHVFGPTSQREYWKEGGQRGKNKDTAEFKTLNFENSSVLDDWNEKMAQKGAARIIERSFSNKVGKLERLIVHLIKEAYDDPRTGLEMMADLRALFTGVDQDSKETPIEKSPKRKKKEISLEDQESLERTRGLKNQ